MNNEPVAWAIKVGKDLVEIVDEKRDFQELVDFYKMEKWDFETVELYTHPADAENVKENMEKVLKQNERLIEALANARITFDAEIEKKNTMLKMWEATHPAKTLTDEEIYKIYLEVEDTKCPSDDFEYMMFARAILRKAQEK